MINTVVKKGHVPEEAARNQFKRIEDLTSPTLGEVLEPSREFVASGINVALTSPEVVKFPFKKSLAVAGTLGNALTGLVSYITGGTAALLSKTLDFVTLGSVRHSVGMAVRRALFLPNKGPIPQG